MIKPGILLDYIDVKVINAILRDKARPPVKALELGIRGRLGQVLELCVGYSCNNSCKYCPVAPKRNLRDRTLEECKKILKDNRRNRNLLIISGGEPTIRKDLDEIISSARNLEYEWIQLKTNGRKFASQEFTKDLAATVDNHPISKGYQNKYGYKFGGLNIFEFYISLCGYNAELHDNITGVSGSFKETVQGIKNLIALHQIVVVNIIITKLNYKFLSSMVEFSQALGVRRVELNFAPAKGNAIKYFSQIIPRLKQVEPYLIRTLKTFKATAHWPPKILIGGIPPCHLPGYETCFAARYFPYDQHTMYLLVDLDNTATYYDLTIKNKTKGEVCQYCSYYPICTGIWKAYSRIYGFSELGPILGNVVEPGSIKDPIKLEIPHLSLELNKSRRQLGLKRVRADTLALLSGGIDSTIAALLYAKNNPDRKVVLITLDHGPGFTPGVEGSRISAAYLKKKYKNIIAHYIIPIPYTTTKKIIFEKLEKYYKKFNYYVTCLACHDLRLTYCIYLLKKYFRGDTIIDGLKSYEIRALKVDEGYLSKYSIRCVHPLQSFKNKKEVVELARQEGFFPILPSQQAGCLLNVLKTRFSSGKTDFVTVKQEYRNRLRKELHQLLKYHGIIC